MTADLHPWALALLACGTFALSMAVLAVGAYVWGEWRWRSVQRARRAWSGPHVDPSWVARAAGPGGLVTEIRDCLDDLLQATEEYADLADKAAQSEVKYKVAYARWMLKSDGAVQVRQSHATVATEDEFLARKIAEARLATQSEVLRTLRARLDALRTLSADARLLQ